MSRWQTLRWLLVVPEPPDYVDVEEHARQRLIAEAEYQAALDAQSKVLRISGSAGAGRERRQVSGLIVRVQGEQL